MKTTMNEVLERQDIEELLPWHAAGTLSRRDAQRVEQALQRDPELARQFALVREELTETILVNETLGAPSALAMNKLMAGIEAESGPAPAKTRLSFGAWISETVAGFSARKLAYAATVGAVIIVAQAGALTSLYVGDRGHDDGLPGTRGIEIGESTRGYTTQSTGSVANVPGSYVLMKFAPGASAAEITKFFEIHRLAIVDGPRAEGVYRVRVSANTLPKDEVSQIAARIRENNAIVGFVAPTE